MKEFLAKHGSKIVRYIGVAAIVGAGVWSVRQTPKALRLLEDEKRRQRTTKLPPAQVVRTTWKCYAAPVAVALTGAGCIIGSDVFDSKRSAALMAACTLSETALSELSSKLPEVLDEKKERELRDAIAQEQIDKNPVDKNTVIHVGNGTTLCVEAITGQPFMSDIVRVERAINNANAQLIKNGCLSLNDYLDALGLNPSSEGDKIGWDRSDFPGLVLNGMLDTCFSSCLNPDKTPVMVIGQRIPPRYGFDRFG